MKEKRGILLISVLMMILFACTDKVVENYAEINDQEILDYLEENNLTATKHESGLYYFIHNEGTGVVPSIYGGVTIKYKGWLTDGTIFDQTTGASTMTFPLSNLVTGWQIGLQLIKEGGKITLYLPSQLGYGSSGSSSIPASVGPYLKRNRCEHP